MIESAEWMENGMALTPALSHRMGEGERNYLAEEVNAGVTFKLIGAE